MSNEITAPSFQRQFTPSPGTQSLLPETIINTPKSTHPRKAFYTMSNKGGVGKSVLAQALLDYLMVKQLGVHAFDTDIAVNQLSQNYPASYVTSFDIKDPTQTSDIINHLYGYSSYQNLLFDLPGGVTNLLAGIFPSGGCARLAAEVQNAGYELNIIIPITPYSGSIQSVRDLITRFGPSVRYHIFKQASFVRGFDKTFDLWERFPVYQTATNETEKEFAEANGANICLMPELPANVLARVDLLRLPFYAAATQSNNAYWSFSHGGNIRDWLGEVYAIFDQIV